MILKNFNLNFKILLHISQVILYLITPDKKVISPTVANQQQCAIGAYDKFKLKKMDYMKLLYKAITNYPQYCVNKI